jgi:hypothetical protein
LKACSDRKSGSFQSPRAIPVRGLFLVPALLAGTWLGSAAAFGKIAAA